MNIFPEGSGCIGRVVSLGKYLRDTATEKDRLPKVALNARKNELKQIPM